VRGEFSLPPADRRRRGAGGGEHGVAQGRRDEPGAVGRAAQRDAARGCAALPRVRLPQRRSYRAGCRTDRGGLHRDPGAPPGRAAAVTDLVLAGGRVVDPARGIDGRLDVTVTGGRLAGPGADGPAAETIDASGLVLVPGLVDLHTHLYEGVSHYGIDPDANCLQRGVTTAVDAGSSGAQTFPGFRRYVIERAQTRVLAFLHVAVQGMISRRAGPRASRRGRRREGAAGVPDGRRRPGAGAAARPPGVGAARPAADGPH